MSEENPDPIAWDPAAPLMRITTETLRANEALQDYARMGAGRSFSKLIERYRTGSEEDPKFSPPTRRMSTIKKWSVRFQWVPRVAAWVELEQDREQMEWEERKAAVRGYDWDLGEEIRAKVREFLLEVPKFRQNYEGYTKDPETGEKIRTVILALNTSLGELARAGKLASDLQRLATDQPTQISKLTGAVLDELLKRAMDELRGLEKEETEAED